MAENHKSFLGTGWAFPPQFLDSLGGAKMSNGEEDIRESLYILLTTTPGERVMNPAYGCDLHSQVFQNITPNTLTIIEDMIATAILMFEPRVRVEAINIDTSMQIEGRLNIEIIYEIKGINSRKNLVYPFYLAEANDM